MAIFYACFFNENTNCKVGTNIGLVWLEETHILIWAFLTSIHVNAENNCGFELCFFMENKGHGKKKALLAV